MKFKNILFVLMLCIGSTHIARSQESISNYSFIQVPENFSFLHSEDQYQLNSLTKFLFNKYGFNAYFPEELPNVRKCDGVYAVVEGNPGFIYTRITVVVKDCYGAELFRSVEGKSKRKDYKGAYQEALRNAFTSFEGLGIKQKDVITSSTATTEEREIEEPVSEQDNNRYIESRNVYVPTARFSNYNNNGKSFLLRKTTEGYSLYQEMKGAEDDLLLVGKLIVKDNVVTYFNTMGEKYKALFTKDKSLIIDLPGGKTQYELVRN